MKPSDVEAMRKKLTQLEDQLDAKRRPKAKKALAKRYELMAEVHDLRGVVRDAELALGTR